VLRGTATLPAAPPVAPALVLPPPPLRRHIGLGSIVFGCRAGRGGVETPAAAAGRSIAAAPPARRLCGETAPLSPLPPPPCRH